MGIVRSVRDFYRRGKRAIFVTILAVKIQVCFAWWKCRRIIQAIEQTGQFSGRYFVLMGHLSPLDGIGPKEIGLDLLQKRLVEESFHEVILATNPTVEGDATANYIAEICHQHNIKVSRIAHGIPVGGELETVDGTTLTHSFLGRRQID